MVPARQTRGGCDIPPYAGGRYLYTKPRLTSVFASRRGIGLRIIPTVDLCRESETLVNGEQGRYSIGQYVLLRSGANGVIENAKTHISKQKEAPAERFTEQEGAEEMRSVGT